MAELEAEAAKSGEKMEDEEPTPKRRRTVKGKGAEDSETDGMEVDVTRQTQWKEDGDWKCDVCRAKSQECRWRVSDHQGTACKWCSDHKVRCEVGGKLVKADGGAVASGSGPKKARSVLRKTSATTVASRTFEPARFPDEHGRLVENVPSVWDAILTAQEEGNTLSRRLIAVVEEQGSLLRRVVGALHGLRADMQEQAEAGDEGMDVDEDESEEDAPGTEEENAGGKGKGKGKAKSTKK
jgi:hypothetical protein